MARYTFLGVDPSARLTVRDGVTSVEREVGVESFDGPPLAVLEGLVRRDVVPDPELPPLARGAVGYLAYDAVRLFESIPDRHPREGDIPDALFLLFEAVVAFDHPRQRVLLLTTIGGADPGKAVSEAIERLDRLEAYLHAPDPPGSANGAGNGRFEPVMARERFLEAVAATREAIAEGEVYQAVVSQRWTARLGIDPFDVYRALRTLNPSPYLYYLETREASILGSSPEMLVRCRNGEVETRPIAGTVPRGATPAEDERLAAALLADPKERAEHVMLVDLARNDLGRICATGTVRVARYAAVEKFSHVQHLVSEVRGRLRDGVGAGEALAACFPAGTLTGAPKIRAMELIDELEAVRRGIYGGAVGLLRFRRQLRPRDRHPHGGRREGALARAGRGRDRRRLDRREGVRRGRVEGRRDLPFDRARARVVRMIFVVDNYDSFTYNLVQALGKLDSDVVVARNDRFDPASVAASRPRAIVISPGPGRPAKAGRSIEMIAAAERAGIPLLGVCLGHQAIAAFHGGTVERAPEPRHGKSSRVDHDGAGIFDGLPRPFEAGRYHSLVVREDRLPEELVVTGRSEDGLDHGSRPSLAARLGRPVPPRIGAHARGRAHPGEFREARLVTPGVADALKSVAAWRTLPRALAEAAFGDLMDGRATQAEQGALLLGIASRGETAEEIAGAVTALRRRMRRVPTSRAPILDTCGPGGLGRDLFNLSTATAVVAAGAGAAVAKHGNRSVSSRVGSADVLAAAGIAVDLEPVRAGRILDETGLVFLFAPSFHPALKELAAVRRELGVRTILNVLGPLANPAGATRQLVGVGRPELAPLLADSLAALGTERAVVFHCENGLDELTPGVAASGVEVEDGRTRPWRLEAAALGQEPVEIGALSGGDAAENADLLARLLDGEPGPRREAVLRNVAVALVVEGRASNAGEGYERARASIDTGAARRSFEVLRAATAAA